MVNLTSYFSIKLDKHDKVNLLTRLVNYRHGFAYLSVAVFVTFTNFSVNAESLKNDSDSDNDGLTDSYELNIGTESYLSDTDGDTVSDGEEIGKNQDKPLDSDNDGVIDALDYDDDNDGLPTYLESKNDTDKDGQLDYLDMDSDNDGITDGEEAGFLNQDKNLDGIDDAFDIGREGAVDNNGDGIDDNFKLPDHNADGKPDYLDAKFQYLKQVLVTKNTQKKNEVAKPITISKTKVLGIKNAGKPAKPIVTKDKQKKSKSTKLPNMIINRHTDSDNDGLSNELEKLLGTNHLNRDSDGDNVSDAIEIGMDVNAPQDSDHDGIIDALDNDDDNDGILTKLEDLNKDSTAINDDTDSDGVPNYLDANDDGDNLLTKAEGFVKDSDGDGILDYLDKNDDTKDQLNSSNAIQVSSDITEPEIVVLFDGDAAALVAEEDENQEEILSSVGSSLQYTQLEVAGNADLDKVTHDGNVGEVQASKSSTKPTSHWNLF